MWRTRSIESCISKLSPLFRINCSTIHWIVLWLRTALFWAIRQRLGVIPYRRFGATYWSHRVKSLLVPWLFKILQNLAVLCLMQSVTGLSTWRQRLDLRTVCVGFVVDTVTLDRVFIEHSIYSVGNTQQMLQAHIFVHLILTLCSIRNWNYPYTKHILLPPLTLKV